MLCYRDKSPGGYGFDILLNRDRSTGGVRIIYRCHFYRDKSTGGYGFDINVVLQG